MLQQKSLGKNPQVSKKQLQMIKLLKLREQMD